MNRPVIILGSGGHAKVLCDMLMQQDTTIIGYTDLMEHTTSLNGVQYLGEDSAIFTYDLDAIDLVLGIGKTANSDARDALYARFAQEGYTFRSVIHHQAIISPCSSIGAGVQIMAGVIIQTDAVISHNVIINTGAIVDHECKVDAHSHVAPGATLCGGVHIGTSCLIGAGATIIPQVTIGDRSIVGAGAVVLESIESGMTVVGVPAREVSA